MQCSFCHSYLNSNEIKDKNILKLCCGVNQIFCYNCLFSPTIIQSWILSKLALSCEDCGSEISMESLLKKRMYINLGTYGQTQFQFGYSYFFKPTVINTPPSSNYGDMYEIQQKFGSGVKNKTNLNSTLFNTADSQKQTYWSTPNKNHSRDDYNFTPFKE